MNQPVPMSLPHAPAARTGQATEVEKSRAGAEVFYSVLAAKQSPRSEEYARAAMTRACQTPRLAERAFFRLARAGDQINGESVHLARELARCWGNVQYGLNELRRDDVAGESEMQAFAWDLETNSRSSHTFIVPHRRDTRQGPKTLVNAQDVYENNANAGARRVREMIFAVLPVWFVEEAKDTCQQTLNRGDGKPRDKRVTDALVAFKGIGVTETQLSDKLGKPKAKWDERDLAQLSVIFKSIERGEMAKDTEFPRADNNRVTGAELTAAAPAAATSTTSSGDVHTEGLAPDDPDLVGNAKVRGREGVK